MSIANTFSNLKKIYLETKYNADLSQPENTDYNDFPELKKIYDYFEKEQNGLLEKMKTQMKCTGEVNLECKFTDFHISNTNCDISIHYPNIAHNKQTKDYVIKNMEIAVKNLVKELETMYENVFDITYSDWTYIKINKDNIEYLLKPNGRTFGFCPTIKFTYKEPKN